MNDKTVEQMIQASGANSPRITPEDVQAAIRSEYYINAGSALSYCTPQPDFTELKLITICILILQNGFKVVGVSSPISPSNFREEIGRKAARDDAVRQIWPLAGYLLKQRLSEMPRFNPEPDSLGDQS